MKHFSIRRHPKPKIVWMCKHPLPPPSRDTKQSHQQEKSWKLSFGSIQMYFLWVSLAGLTLNCWASLWYIWEVTADDFVARSLSWVLSFCTIRPEHILPDLWLVTGRFMGRHSYRPHITSSDLYLFRAPKKYPASNMQQTLTWSKPSPPAYTHVTFILHRDTSPDALMPIVTMSMSCVYHLRPMCYVYTNSTSSRHLLWNFFENPFIKKLEGSETSITGELVALCSIREVSC
jgi:hypothetical protein